MTTQEIIEKIRQYANDPLGKIYFCEYQVLGGVIRWNGTVSYRENGDDYFTVMDTKDFFDAIDELIQ